LIPSVLLGIPFPLAMRFEATTDRERAYAWAANGCASVIASPAAALMAMSLGLRFLLMTAAISYFLMLIGAAAGGRWQQSRGQGGDQSGLVAQEGGETDSRPKSRSGNRGT
ncbi:MAG: hypothetical protein ABSG21_14410, partial [Spirochaetia bacterium]